MDKAVIGWSRYGRGYECSSAGDKRFSALYAQLGGRSIEAVYQCDVKGYCPGGSNWRAGKGKPPLDRTKDMYTEYLKLWRQWAAQHPALITELRARAEQNGCLLTDRFASSPVSQARALAEILNS